MKKYIVKYVVYHYNDGRGNNGFETQKEYFEDLEDAIEWSKLVQENVRIEADLGIAILNTDDIIVGEIDE